MTSRWSGRRIAAHHLSTPARFFSAALAIALVATGIATAARLQIPPHGDRSVHDLAGVLDAGTIEVMERRHAELYRKTGVAIVVITVPRLEDEALADFAVRVGTEWGVGKKGDDRGLVVAVTTEEPHIFVSTGYGVESFLTDGRVGAILDRYVVSPLRAKEFSTALLQASDALVGACAGNYGVTIEGVESRREPRPSQGDWRTSLPVIVFVLLFILFRIFVIPFGRRGRYRGVWYGGGFGGGFGGDFGGGGGGGFGGFGGGGFGGGGAGR